MLERLIRDYLTSSKKERAEHEAATERAFECEREAARILERAAARAKKKTDEAERIREELRRKPVVGWVESVVKPIADALSEATGLRNKVSGPCGICSRVFVTLCENPEAGLLGQDHKTITLQPDFHEGELTIVYETEEKTERFAKGTLGEMNGMNIVTAPLPNDVDEILGLMRDVPSLRKAVGLEK